MMLDVSIKEASTSKEKVHLLLLDILRHCASRFAQIVWNTLRRVRIWFAGRRLCLLGYEVKGWEVASYACTGNLGDNE